MIPLQLLLDSASKEFELYLFFYIKQGLCACYSKQTVLGARSVVLALCPVGPVVLVQVPKSVEVFRKCRTAILWK